MPEPAEIEPSLGRTSGSPGWLKSKSSVLARLAA